MVSLWQRLVSNSWTQAILFVSWLLLCPAMNSTLIQKLLFSGVMQGALCRATFSTASVTQMNWNPKQNTWYSQWQRLNRRASSPAYSLLSRSFRMLKRKSWSHKLKCWVWGYPCRTVTRRKGYRLCGLHLALLTFQVHHPCWGSHGNKQLS